MQNLNSKFKSDIKTRTYKYAIDVISCVEKLPSDMSTQVLVKQLLRAATSIGANIVEARASSSRREFTNFINHSLKSANESKYWIELLRDARKIDCVIAECLIKETGEIANILASSILTLKRRREF